MRRHAEYHRNDRVGWLRAAVLGANDGIVSTASLVLGIAASGAPHRVVLLTAVSGMVAGAMAMAAGEFVSVHSQQDAENADLERERAELAVDPVGERRELSRIYAGRGLSQGLADQVAAQLTAHNNLAAHVRDELGMSSVNAAGPTQAGAGIGCEFWCRRSVAHRDRVARPYANLLSAVATSSLIFLAALGALSAGPEGPSSGREPRG
jgi:vacuolar iron transporter family protein